MEYANSVWAPYKMKHIVTLEKVQQRATRTLPELRELRYKDRLKALNLPTLMYRRLPGDMLETYKFMNRLYDLSVVPNLELRNNPNLRRHSKALKKTRSSKILRANLFTRRIVNTRKNLPEMVVSAPSVNSFKDRLDRLWEKG